MNAETIKSCPKCHAPVPPEAPQGLCPKCLLVAASTQTEGGQPAEAEPPPPLATIAAAFPQLEILEFIGMGGMGLVFKARQPKLDRFVALKLLPQKPGADPAFSERFHREARVLARLSHPNIVAVHDFGQADPFFYLLMEFVDGVNLRQAMRAGRFTSSQALALVPKICDALQYAHEEGILHRDIKPENLLLDTRGRIKIADFGIAKLLGNNKDITLTASGARIGTPHYMAPEQLERPHEVDQRADVYSLGVVFYEMLTGELPIGRFVPPSEKAPMDPRVDHVVLRALEKERERRFQTAGDVRTEVEHITANPPLNHPGPTSTLNLSGAAQPLPPPCYPSVTTPPSSNSGWSLRAILAAVLVSLSLFVFGLVVLNRIHSGPSEVALLFLLIGLPAVAGTVVAWRNLHDFQSGRIQGRGRRLALVTTVAWPLLLLNLALLFSLWLSAESLQWQMVHARSGVLTHLATLVGTVALLSLDFFVLRKWLTDKLLPLSDLQARLSGISLRARWVSGLALAVLALMLLLRHRQISRLEEPTPATFVQELNAPPGYEVAPGGAPGDDGRLYSSTVTIPPGYALTLATVHCSNEVVLASGLADAAMWLVAPEGQPVTSRLTWRLLGNTMLADGAPLQLSLHLPTNPEHVAQTLHVVPPEPVAIDWVGEPSRLWPPLNGHTKYLIIKGSSVNQGTENHPPTEWAVGIEARLDPIPADLVRGIKSPIAGLGTNWLASLAPPSTTSTNQPVVTVPAVSPKKLVEYLEVCDLINLLEKRERELINQLTPNDPQVARVREIISSHLQTKKQLEEENPGIALVNVGPAQASLPKSQQ